MKFHQVYREEESQYSFVFVDVLVTRTPKGSLQATILR